MLIQYHQRNTHHLDCFCNFLSFLSEAMNLHFHVLLLIIMCCFMLNKVHSSRNKPEPNPDSFILACGASNNATDETGKFWGPDMKFLTSSDNVAVASAQFQDPSLPSTIPYMTARIFKSRSTYKFSVSPRTRHWIRLHFYPSRFENFDISDAFFSVTASEFTLLNNFSASITATALTQAYIIREFSLVPTPSGTLDITFTPSPAYSGSFAFVNGLEVISMPEIFQAVPMVGFWDQSMDIKHSTMQTMFRLNVGGQYIQPGNDSGLGRTWYDDMPYLYGAASGVTSQADKNVTIEYPGNVPGYIAPVEVYSTARSMGKDGNGNLNYNLTWVFQVDANYTYFVRLHFCDYQLSRINQRVFDIFINNQTAFHAADVIAWSKAKGVPVYKDFAIYVKDQDGVDDQLWVALHPSVSSKPEFYDAILNGLEIFKVSNTDGNLAGPNPVPSQLLLQVEAQQRTSFAAPKKSSNHGLVVGAILGAFGGFCLIVGLFTLFRHRKKMNSQGQHSTSSWLPIYGSSRTSGTRTTTFSGKSTVSSSISNVNGSLCRHFALAEIRLGTNNFDESQVIGVGGFGKVYKGYIDGGTKVAVKRSNPSADQGVHEFQTEIDLLSKLRHRHLVSLIGACEEDNEMILVYDYMANGTLREHLYKSNKRPLSWQQRIDICIGAARGLHYLHTGAKQTIIHRDVKTTNILLDEKWIAKVSDFGLSKTGPGIHQTHVSTMVKGSFGYLDPEYFRRQQLTDKSDVYSFGVVLFEVLCGRPALSASLPKEQVSLADWAVQCYRKGNLEGIIDPHIREEITPECLKHFAEAAVKCLSDHGLDRPTMGSVLWNLEYAKQLQRNPDGPELVVQQKANDAYKMHETLLNIEDEVKVVEKPEDCDDSAVFSQIVNPEGR